MRGYPAQKLAIAKDIASLGSSGDVSKGLNVLDVYYMLWRSPRRTVRRESVAIKLTSHAAGAIQAKDR
jgi:hypothetical protein